MCKCKRFNCKVIIANPETIQSRKEINKKISNILSFIQLTVITAFLIILINLSTSATDVFHIRWTRHPNI